MSRPPILSRLALVGVYLAPLGSVLFNVLLLSFCLFLCRVFFICNNWEPSIFEWTYEGVGAILLCGLEFDVSAALILNVPCMLMQLYPCDGKADGILRKCARWYFVVSGVALLCLVLSDAVFYSFTQRRFTLDMFQEFSNETNILRILLLEVADYWYLLFAVAGFCFLLWRCFLPKCAMDGDRMLSASSVALFFLVPAVCLLCYGRRLLNPSESIDEDYLHRVASNVRKADFVVNTPYKLYFSFNERDIDIPDFFTHQQLEEIYPIVHLPDTTAEQQKRNIFVLIVESLSPEMMSMGGDASSSQMPFLDSLFSVSTCFSQSFANGTASIDAMPSIFASVPKMWRPFVARRTNKGNIPSLPRELKNWGYSSAFFHGGNNASMGFRAFALDIGFERYYGRSEYNADSRFGGDEDFDGTWAVWDEEFLQFTALTLNDLSQPFVAGAFTASSHHPFAIPDKHKGKFTQQDKIERCVRYTDYSLQTFFSTASRQPWFENTIFIITADHTAAFLKKARRRSSLAQFRIPICIFDPQKRLPSAPSGASIQQIDLFPTILGAIGYDRPFVSLGRNAFAEQTVARTFNCASTPQYIEGEYLLRLCNIKEKGQLYNYKTDPLLQCDLYSSQSELADSLEAKARAFMQRYKQITK